MALGEFESIQQRMDDFVNINVSDMAEDLGEALGLDDSCDIFEGLDDIQGEDYDY